MTATAELRERTVQVERNGQRVPAVLWIPPATQSPPPLVLVGHGGGGHKRAPTVVAMADGFVREHGIAVLAIDGPVNGERASNDDNARALREQDRDAYRRRYYLEQYDAMVADWRAALDAAQALPEIGSGPVGYWGLSMGTRFGVPLVAVEPRIRAAVIGLFGYREGDEIGQRVYDDAPKLAVPVLFLQQLNDEEVGQRAYHDLFRRIGTADKRLHGNPGGHASLPRSELEASRLFLARKLRAQCDA